jgi:hypothetical protein
MNTRIRCGTDPQLLLGMILTFSLAAVGSAADDWPQAAHDARRTARSADQPEGPYVPAWSRHWNGESIFNRQQPIVIDRLVYVGTHKGVVRALALDDGAEVWAAAVGGPILHALAGDQRLVYVGAFDGALYALDRQLGTIVWTCPLSRRGFSSAPLLMDDVLYIGCRDGVFYAVSTAGEKLWQFDSGTPIVQTAAGAEGKVVFANESVQVFCLDARRGTRLWSQAVPGRTARDWWPVIHEGKVVVRTAEAGSAHLTGHMQELQTQLKPRAATPEQVVAEQHKFQAFLAENHFLQTGFVFNLEDGRQPYAAGLSVGSRNTGVPPPPVLGGDGRLYTVYRTSAGKNGIIDITDCGLGHFNLQTGRMDHPLLIGAGTQRRPPFELTSDETVSLAAAGDLVIGMRCDTDPGSVHIKTGRTEGTRGLGGIPRAADLQPGGNGIAISDRYLLFVKFGTVVCLTGQDRTQEQ